jgi:hypothetical protein
LRLGDLVRRCPRGAVQAGSQAARGCGAVGQTVLEMRVRGTRAIVDDSADHAAQLRAHGIGVVWYDDVRVAVGDAGVGGRRREPFEFGRHAVEDPAEQLRAGQSPVSVCGHDDALGQRCHHRRRAKAAARSADHGGEVRAAQRQPRQGYTDSGCRGERDRSFLDPDAAGVETEDERDGALAADVAGRGALGNACQYARLAYADGATADVAVGECDEYRSAANKASTGEERSGGGDVGEWEERAAVEQCLGAARRPHGREASCCAESHHRHYAGFLVGKKEKAAHLDHLFWDPRCRPTAAPAGYLQRCLGRRDPRLRP